jgi:hypothetical protein
MNRNAIARQYHNLTPEERFKLILAAGARSDAAEQERLLRAGGRVALSLADHEPHARAFDELAVTIYVELLARSADYVELILRAGDGEHPSDDEDEQDEAVATADSAELECRERLMDLALLKGFYLKTTADGWNQFCAAENLPALAIWECMPGFARLRDALALAERAAFIPEGVVAWLNRMRDEGKPEVTQPPVTPDEVAAWLGKQFRERVKWWGGA